MSAKELKDELGAAKFLRDFWLEKIHIAERTIGRLDVQIAKIEAELSQVSA